MSNTCPRCGNNNAIYLLTSYLCPNDSCMFFDKALKEELAEDKDEKTLYFDFSETLISPVSTCLTYNFGLSGYDCSVSGNDFVLTTNTSGSLYTVGYDYDVQADFTSTLEDRIEVLETKVTSMESSIEQLISAMSNMTAALQKLANK